MEKKETLDEVRVIPDLRYYAVFDRNGDDVGFVVDMIYAGEFNALKYLKLDCSIQAPGKKYVLVPVGFAFIKKGTVHLEEIEKDTLFSCPDFDGHEVDDDFEEALFQCLIPQPGKIARNPDEYFVYDHFFEI